MSRFPAPSKRPRSKPSRSLGRGKSDKTGSTWWLTLDRDFSLKYGVGLEAAGTFGFRRFLLSHYFPGPPSLETLYLAPFQGDAYPHGTFPEARYPMKRQVVRARAFEVVDDSGNVRGTLGLSDDNSPFLSLLDPDGQVRVRISLNPDGAAGLAIGDRHGKVRAQFGLSSDGSANLALGDRNGKIRAKFGLVSENAPTPGLRVGDDGEVNFVYSLAEQGSPTLGLYDEAGKVRIRLGLAAEGSPILRLLTAEGELKVIMGLDGDGAPVLQFTDSEGKPTWSASQ